MRFVKPVRGGFEITVKVVPGASRDRIVGPLGDALKVQVSAPPERGKANAAVESLLASVLGLQSRDVAVVRGQTSPRKTVLVCNVPVDALAAAFGIESAHQGPGPTDRSRRRKP